MFNFVQQIIFSFFRFLTGISFLEVFQFEFYRRVSAISSIVGGGYWKEDVDSTTARIYACCGKVAGVSCALDNPKLPGGNIWETCK